MMKLTLNKFQLLLPLVNYFFVRYNKEKKSSKLSSLNKLIVLDNIVILSIIITIIISHNYVIVGIILCLIAFITIIVIIIKTLVFTDPVSGWPSLACIVIFMGGLQLFFFGIMGMYISKLYLEVKKRPIYIVSETEQDLK